MRLFYSPAACSISAHIVLEEIGEPFESTRVLTKEGGARTDSFLKMNPKGKVPVLVLDDGRTVTETPVILQFLARTHPAAGLMPRDFTQEFEVLQVCEYLSNTVHNYGLTRIFQPGLFSPDEGSWARVREQGREVVEKALELLAPKLEGAPMLFERFSIADASLFFFEYHAGRLRIPMPGPVAGHFARMLERQSVQAVLRREDLNVSDVLPAAAT